MIKKIAIIGAGGVGSALAFNLLERFSLESLVLVDIKEDRAKAVAYDLEDTRGILSFSTAIEGTSNYSLIKNSDIVVFSAGSPRRQGMTRLDLLKVNSAIAQAAASKIKKYCPKSIVIAVTNPLDIITYLILRKTRFSRQKVIGMGSSLDTSRLLNILFKDTGVSAGSWQSFAFGPHSKDMLVGFSSGSYPLKPTKLKAAEKKVKLRGAKIVNLLKDRSAIFGPALACFKLIEAIAFDRGQVIPVSVLLKGECGVDDVCLGVPCLIRRQGAVEIVEGLLTSAQKKKLKKISIPLRQTLKRL